VNKILERIIALIGSGQVRISEHGYDELAADGIFVRDLVEKIDRAKLVENYPDYPKGPCVLVLQLDRDGQPVHVVWGIPRGAIGPAVLVTAYRPDYSKWSNEFMRRIK
jgi:Domain of unknown function (DUF4258)